MKLIEALEIMNRPTPKGASRLGVDLACGFTPLHLETFLSAELRLALPTIQVNVSVGIFDDLVGNIERAGATEGDVVVAVLEWADLDARLGLRRLGGWTPADVADIVQTAEQQVARLGAVLARTAVRKRVVCSLPSLPLPPIFLQRTQETGPQELELRALVASMARDVSSHSSVQVVSSRKVDLASAPSERHDPKSELATGFPYSVAHASALAEVLASLAAEQRPKKGLVTDLDDTLWRGVVGEIGAENVSWSEDGGAHTHALYQQFVASLAAAGVLVAAASKNESSLVEDVFARADILLSKDAVFPLEIHWGSKSDSVGRILETWNVGAGDVVFVDDSPLEVAQVQSVFPEIEGFVFPQNDYPALLELIEGLRDRFGKRDTNEEDALRLESIRSATHFRSATGAPDAASLDEFLRGVRGEIVFKCGRGRDTRAFELINKTTQFNLNGDRLTEAAFGRALEADDAFLLTASYGDKFGSLGKIAAMLGRVEDETVLVCSWVMSCRAFTRRIEYQCLSFLFEKFAASEVVATYRPTERNTPLRTFLGSLLDGELTEGAVAISRAAFKARAPALVHGVVEIADD
jgi:FkbH-like protein